METLHLWQASLCEVRVLERRRGGEEETVGCKVRHFSSPHGLVKVWLDRAGVEEVEVEEIEMEVTATNKELGRGTKTRNTRF